MAETLRTSGLIAVSEPDEAGVLEALRSASALITYEWRPEYLVPGIRWIQSISAGVDQFPIEALKSAGVALTSASGVHGPQVAEHVFALLLALTRAIGVSMRDAVEHRWRPRSGFEISGTTMAVLGLGTIGEEIARRAQAWGIHVIGTKSDPSSYRGAASFVAGPSETVEVCRQAEIVVCVLPDTESTRGLVDAEVLEAIGEGWLVNVGRGTVVDEDALLHALDRGRLRGAGLDVFSTEPLPEDSALWSHPRVVITPHIAGFSPRYGERLLAVIEENCAALAGRRPWRGRVV